MVTKNYEMVTNRNTPISVWFDMDGTLFDLYAVPNWLKELEAESSKPYELAKEMVNLEELGILLGKLQTNGIKVGVISWLSKNSTREYSAKVRKAKREALRKIPFEFDEIHLVKYGTPKKRAIKVSGIKILFDDNEEVLMQWESKRSTNSVGIKVPEKDILNELKIILERVS